MVHLLAAGPDEAGPLKLPAWAARLRCPACSGPLDAQGAGLSCRSCARGFPLKDGAVFLAEAKPSGFETGARRSDDFITRIKLGIKNSPAFFSFFYWLSGYFAGTSAAQAVRDLPADALILNLASGVKRVRADAVNVDSHPFPGVQLVADAARLPFQDGAADAVVCESLLEHAQDADAVVREMARVAKQGGLVYVLTPFLLGYHSSPHDYRRWTLDGLRDLLKKDFDEVESGVAFGPTVAFNHLLASWLALPLSLGSAKLYQFIAAAVPLLLGRLSCVDWLLVRHPNAADISHAIYFLGRRK